jgi:DNA polymerase kappa
MDAFFANVELLYNPSLQGKAFGVRYSLPAGLLTDKRDQVGHGVLTTASYEARKFGVRSGMAGLPIYSIPYCCKCDKVATGFIAKKLCPHLIFVPNNFSRYSEMSDMVMNIFRRYDPNMCPAGTDEAYLK